MNTRRLSFRLFFSFRLIMRTNKKCGATRIFYTFHKFFFLAAVVTVEIPVSVVLCFLTWSIFGIHFFGISHNASAIFTNSGNTTTGHPLITGFIVTMRTIWVITIMTNKPHSCPRFILLRRAGYRRTTYREWNLLRLFFWFRVFCFAGTDWLEYQKIVTINIV